MSSTSLPKGWERVPYSESEPSQPFTGLGYEKAQGGTATVLTGLLHSHCVHKIPDQIIRDVKAFGRNMCCIEAILFLLGFSSLEELGLLPSDVFKIFRANGITEKIPAANMNGRLGSLKMMQEVIAPAVTLKRSGHDNLATLIKEIPINSSYLVRIQFVEAQKWNMFSRHWIVVRRTSAQHKTIIFFGVSPRNEMQFLLIPLDATKNWIKENISSKYGLQMEKSYIGDLTALPRSKKNKKRKKTQKYNDKVVSYHELKLGDIIEVNEPEFGIDGDGFSSPCHWMATVVGVTADQVSVEWFVDDWDVALLPHSADFNFLEHEREKD